jgi:hypothetical protein
MFSYRASTQMLFCPKTLKLESWNSQNWDKISHCWCYCWSITLLMLLVMLPSIHLNHSPLYCCYYHFVLLVIISHCMCFDEVLPSLPLPCKWWVGGPPCYCTSPTIKYPPLPFIKPLLLVMLTFIALLLLVRCVACAMVKYYPTHYLVQVVELLCDKKTNGKKVWVYSLAFL